MKIGIMQPYFMPYIGYFALIKYTDYFVLFDTPQFIRQGWINRNRLLDNQNIPQYMIIPVMKDKRETPINKIEISSHYPWEDRIRAQLSVYKKKAPYYKMVTELMEDIFAQKFNLIADLNEYSLSKVCEYLGLPYKYDVFSRMNLEIEQVNAADEWALNITHCLNYDTYVNPPGGMQFYDREKYRNKNVKLEFLKPNLDPYDQKNSSFQEGLSIVDVMMFCSPKEVLDQLDSFIILV